MSTQLWLLLACFLGCERSLRWPTIVRRMFRVSQELHLFGVGALIRKWLFYLAFIVPSSIFSTGCSLIMFGTLLAPDKQSTCTINRHVGAFSYGFAVAGLRSKCF